MVMEGLYDKKACLNTKHTKRTTKSTKKRFQICLCTATNLSLYENDKINHRDTEIAQRDTEVIAHLFYEATHMSLRGTKITERSELGEANPVPFSFMAGGRSQCFDYTKIEPSNTLKNEVYRELTIGCP